MSIFFPYPVIDLNPSFTKIHSNYSFEEYRSIVLNTGLAGGVGYFFQWLKPSKHRYYLWGAGVGLAIGMTTNHYQVSSQFRGLLPNQKLVQKYGKLSDKTLIENIRKESLEEMKKIQTDGKKKEGEEEKKYPMIALYPSTQQILESVTQYDILRIIACGIAFAVNGWLVVRFFQHGRKREILDPNSRETVYSFIGFNGLLAGITIEYKVAQYKFLGFSPNEKEQKQFGILNELGLLKEIMEGKYPDIDFKKETNKIDWKEISLTPQALHLIELTIKAQYPMVDLSNVHFETLKYHGKKENDRFREMIKSAGYDDPDFLM